MVPSIFSSRRLHTRFSRDWSSDVCSSDLVFAGLAALGERTGATWAEAVIAGYAAYVHRMTGADDVVLGSPVMGRLGTAALRTPRSEERREGHVGWPRTAPHGQETTVKRCG